MPCRVITYISIYALKRYTGGNEISTNTQGTTPAFAEGLPGLASVRAALVDI